MIAPEVKDRLLVAVEDLAEELVRLTTETIRIPSVNPTLDTVVREEVIGGESQVNQFLQPVMAEMGLETDLWEEERGRANLVGIYKSSGNGRSLLFNGHVDTVAPGPGELWTEAEYERLFGAFPPGGPRPTDGEVEVLAMEFGRTPDAINWQWGDGAAYCLGGSASTTSEPLKAWLDERGLGR